MAIGERIRTFRNLRNMTLRWLGMAVGFPEKTADIRMAQYEKGTRTPKEDLTNKLAEVLDVSPRALDVPDIDSKEGLLHTLFVLEDIYGLTIGEFEGRTCLYLNRNAPDWLRTATNDWKQEAQKFHNDEMPKDEYDRWRYNYPKYVEVSSETVKQNVTETDMRAEGGIYARVPSKEFSDAMIERLRRDGIIE